MTPARLALALVISLIAAPPAKAQQQLGTKIMGGLGIDAGTQAPPGFYIVDRFLQFTADKARDRNGALLPIQGLDILARANAFGVAYTFATKRGPFLTVAASAPYARVSVNSDDPIASLDRNGLGDILVQPVKAGWQRARFDVVTAYAVFAPTGKFEPKTGVGVGRGFWTHQLSAGGAVYADSARRGRASVLASYEINSRKRGVDIKRGNLFHVQGGAGGNVFKTVVVGAAGYGLWQVQDDRGSALPPKLAGARTRSFGLGPEVDVVIPKLGLRAELRYEWDVGVRARPQGEVLTMGLAYRAWAPAKK